MNELKLFENPEFGNVRTIETNDGKVMFCGADIAKALGYNNSPDAIQKHCRKDGIAKCDSVDSIGRKNTLTFINEGNVYRLITHSKLPNAERFEKWVFEEVLPSIRKHGAYMTEDTLAQAIANPDFAIGLLNALKSEQEKNKRLETKVSALTVDNEVMRPKAEYFDDLVDRNLLTNFRDTAKELKIGQKEFMDFLFKNGYIYRDTKGKPMPYNRYVTNGLFELKEYVNKTTGHVGQQALITPKGRETFRLLYIGNESED